jgi:hypothetical protein
VLSSLLLMDIEKLKHQDLGGCLAAFFGLCCALLLAWLVGAGAYLISLGAALVAVGFGIGLALGSKYYYLIPLGMSLNLPALPIGGGRNLEVGEAAVLGVSVLALLRFAFKQQPLRFVRWAFVGILLYTAWVILILWQNPVGFSILGGSTGGGRFYLKIFMACVGMIILANQKISEQDAKWIIWIILGASWISAFYGIADYFGLTPAIYRQYAFFEESDDFYTWHQILSIPALWTVTAVFALRRPSQVFTPGGAGWIGLLLLTLAIGMFSGKRAAIAAMLIVPIVASVFYREYRYTLLSAIGIVMVICVVVMGQGNLFSAPLTVQRALSWLPGDWDPEIEGIGSSDKFRELLRYWAREEIMKDPLWGRGGFKINFAELSVLEYTQMNQDERTTLGHALSSNWHNTWLGIAADFGVPASVFFGVFVVQWLVLSYGGARQMEHGSYLHALAMLSFYNAILFVARSWTSGHSAQNAFEYWWIFALGVALRSQALRDANSRISTNVIDTVRPVPPVNALERSRRLPRSSRG